MERKKTHGHGLDTSGQEVEMQGWAHRLDMHLALDLQLDTGLGWAYKLERGCMG